MRNSKVDLRQSFFEENCQPRALWHYASPSHGVVSPHPCLKAERGKASVDLLFDIRVTPELDVC